MLNHVLRPARSVLDFTATGMLNNDTHPTYRLTTASTHGFFTVGCEYPCLKLTEHGNGGSRGFYIDDKGATRMVKADLFSSEPTGEWKVPEPCRFLQNRDREQLARRWGFSKQAVYVWQRGSHPLRFNDLVRGAELEPKHDIIEDFREFSESHGFYMQEVAVRWGFQQFGQTLSTLVADPRRTVFFWDMWRGMKLNIGAEVE